MASTSTLASSTTAFVVDDAQHELIIAPDDSDFVDSDAESTTHPDDRLIENAVLDDVHPSTSAAERNVRQGSPGKLWPAHPLIRIHKRLWFTYFNDELPREEDLNVNNGQGAAWKNFDDGEIKKYVDVQETNPSRLHWFNIDHDLVYLSFWFDWGPLSVGMFYRFCLHVHHMLTDPDMQDATLVLYTTDAPAQKANAALLVTLYAMIIGKISPADAFYPISELEFKPFRDAGYGRADYNLSIQDILYGIHRSINESLLDLTTFNLDEYEKYEQVNNGDWNWITPHFIAFASPNDRAFVEALRIGGGRLPSSYTFHPPSENQLFGKTIKNFKDRGVKLVVRLNNPLYDRQAFTSVGIDHSDMYFDDGSNPSDEILTDFIERADKVIAAGGVVAVHCKAGLGRTGVLIGAYLVWKHGFSAGEAIGFMRFMRPGCVVGPQQHFMYQNFVQWVKWGVRDHAIKQANQLIAQEKAKLEAVLAEANAQTAKRASVKRRAVGSDAAKHDDQADNSLSAEHDHDDDDDQEDVKHAHKHARRNDELSDTDDEDDQRPRQKKKADVAMQSEVEAPVTPKAQRGGSRGVPQSAAPAVKPAPCVGQPRKSPSPSRKKPAIQPPATVARLELTSKRYPAATRSFNNHLLLSSHAVHVDTNAASGSGNGGGVDTVTPTAEADDKVRDSPTQASASASVSPRGATATAAAAAAAGVLVESRINVAAVSTTSRASPKAAMVNLTPSPVARVRGFERTRCNTISTATVTATVTTPIRGSSRAASPSSPQQAQVFRASPSVRDRYGLRDSSQSPPTTPRRVEAGLSRSNSPVKVAAQAGVGMSDAEVLGVIDCIPQTKSRTASSPAPRPARSSPKKELVQPAQPQAHVTASVVVADENDPRQVHRAPLTIASTGSTAAAAATQAPKVIRTVRAKPTLTTTTVARKPVSTTLARTTPAAIATSGVRSVFAKIPASTTAGARPTVVRAQKSVSELRSTATVRARTPAPAPAPALPTQRSVSNSSTLATVNASASSRPASRLTAPTAASAARAAAAVAKRTNLARGGGVGVGVGVRKVSALSKGASITSDGSATGALRRRRSSTGDAGLDMVA